MPPNFGQPYASGGTDWIQPPGTQIVIQNKVSEEISLLDGV